MQHRSGLPRDWYESGEPFPYDRYFSVITRQQVIAGINPQAFDFAPGSTWSYSNAGYMLLGYAIESITGRQYAEFFHSEFALPFGLIDTGVCGMFNLPRPDGYGLFGFPLRDIAVAVITNAWPVPTDQAQVIASAVASAALGAL